MKEIGGYPSLEQFVHNEYYTDVVAVNSARYALLYLLKAKKIQKLYLPYFLCDSVARVCNLNHVAVEYYSISPDFLPIFEKELQDNTYLYIVNIYGQLDASSVLRLKTKYHHIIWDNVQAFFQKPVHGVDTIYSCRKFFGVPDGGYLSSTARLSEPLEADNSRDRMGYLLGRFEVSGSAYYAEYKATEEGFHETGLRAMSQLTHNLLGAIDYNAVRCRRNENYAVLSEALGKTNQLQLRADDGPYCYPYYCKNGMEAKRTLAKQGIYIPTFWPNVVALAPCLEKDYAENILPLPCDQRYDKNDMTQIYSAIKCL